MRTLLVWFWPDLLTAKLSQLSVAQTHWVATKLSILEGLHDWMHEMCPCAAFDLGDEDLEQVSAS